jgi:UDP-N-acetylmuramyl pentapeptide phosphotransferase/UDP-N-acetylglucosamine-1-phosphate transferase
MARRSKGEDVLLGLIGIIGLIIAILYAIFTAIVSAIIAYWFIVLGLALILLMLLILDDYINLRRNNKKIDELNKMAEISRSNVQMDYQNFIINEEILNMFDNAVIHFPQKTFLDPEYLYSFEATYLSTHHEYPNMEDTKNRLLSYKYNVNKVGINFFKQ